MNTDPTTPIAQADPLAFDPEAPDHRRRDLSLTIGVIVSIITAIGMLGSAVIFGPAILHTDSTTDALRNSDDLRACTASFSAELVTGPTAAALKALSTSGSDSRAFRHAVASADPARFIRLSRMARNNPDQFLAACHRDINRPFRNCKEAHANGYLTVAKDQPGYSTRLDADRDGIGCE